MIPAMSESKAIILGASGTTLTPDETAFFRDQRPWGFIVFARNVESAAQLRDLAAAMRDCAGRPDAPVFVDQEGGRVQRLRPPLARNYPPAAALGALYRHDARAGLRAAWLMSRLHAFDLLRCGLNADCLPVLDVPVEGAHDVIGNRAYGKDPETVAAMGRAAADGLLAGGVLPVIKHIPGHGRAAADTHFSLPVVDTPLDELRRHDFAPFAALKDIAMAMTAHVVYAAIDADNPATTSRPVVEDIIRGEIGFDGLLMSDDVSMNALSGDFAARTDAIFAAGCDVVLHCSGLMEEMKVVAGRTPALRAGHWSAPIVRWSRSTGATVRTSRPCATNSQVFRGGGLTPPNGMRVNETVDTTGGKPMPMDRLWADTTNAGAPTSRRWLSTSTVSRDLSICCCIWRATRRSTLPASRCWRSPNNIWPSSIACGPCGSRLAADYLVMAAWLAFLKSKLLIPKQPGDEGESGEELAAILQFRLKRLEAMRDAAARLVNRNRLGRDVFARGMPEAVIVERRNEYAASLYDLLTAYASQRQRRTISNVTIEKRGVWSLKEARSLLMRLIGQITDWTALDQFLIQYLAKPADRATALASSFAATLELVREGQVEIRQHEPFAPLYMRSAAGNSAVGVHND